MRYKGSSQASRKNKGQEAGAIGSISEGALRRMRLEGAMLSMS